MSSPNVGRPQPDGAVVLVDVAARAQLLERPLDRAGLAQRGAPTTRCRSGPRSAPGSPRSAPASPRSPPSPSVSRSSAVTPAAASSLGQLDDVIAGVAVLGRLLTRASARRSSAANSSHLGAGVVEVVLALDRVPAVLEHPRERVAVGGAAAAGGGHRPGRVGAHELDQDPLAPRRLRCAPSRSPAASSGGDRLAVPAIGEEEVEEAGARRPRSARRSAAEGAIELGAQPLGDLARRRARPPARAASPRWSSSRRARASAGARG